MSSPLPQPAARFEPADSAVDVMVARQPIFDGARRVIGYELLYRSLAHDPVSPESATANLVLRSFSDLGLDALVGDRPAYINVTRSFLLAVRPLPLSPRRTVIEILEDQAVDAALIDVAAELLRGGFRLALDDFRYSAELEPLLDLAATVKLDVQALSPAELAREAARLRRRKLCLIAEKVETVEEYRRCRALGFDAYQGFFFARPELASAAPTPTRDLATMCALSGTDNTTGSRSSRGSSAGTPASATSCCGSPTPRTCPRTTGSPRSGRRSR